ncbi:serine/threonine-protein kinase RIO3 [Sitodiplosis mosellana]|uniref:serine/threonine-protein kinase RIO3 n=1 Tax=Sitodiplosis mosellana TaxID=263140 RepID=UPI00244384F5|nr:serine/threonine-protein kinase RIO3 [Sitodiplosis mosellana]
MASAWKKVEPVESCNLQEIMSEEYARGLQDKENQKYEEHLKDMAGPFIDPPFATRLENDSVPTIVEGSSKDTKMSCQNQLNDIPEDVLNFIRNDTELSQSVDFGDSDRLLAEMLQAAFDKEHDDEVNRIEKHTNKDSKINVSFSNFRRQHPANTYLDSDEYDDYDEPPKNWDRFEANDKIIRGMNKKGLGHDEDGVVITKHDAEVCGVRNAGRLMSFPTEFATGDAGGFDMKLSNSVFNQLKSYSQKSKKTNKAQDRRENKETAEMGIDEPTRLRLYKLINNQILEQVNGIISTGKEAVILHANSDPSYSGELILPKECAVKIFKTTLNEFKQRDRYIKDDYRFKDRFSKQNNRTVIHMWAEKEMHNLMRMQKIGINCPEVIALKKNLLLMSFIGENNIAAPKLKNAILSAAELIIAYEEVVDIMVRLYNEAKLVHADLSEYNILWHDGKCWLIDVAQSVEPGHPSALEFLMRDCDNISTFFTRKGVSGVKTKEELFSHITTLDPSVHNAAMLERMHAKGPTETMATAQDMDEVPEQVKPISYPFDYAWNKTQEQKMATTAAAVDIDALFATN